MTTVYVFRLPPSKISLSYNIQGVSRALFNGYANSCAMMMYDNIIILSSTYIDTLYVRVASCGASLRCMRPAL